MLWLRRNNGNNHRRWDNITAAEVARALDAHMSQCRVDKEEIRSKLDEQSSDVAGKHAENLQRFGKIERTIYIAMGGGAAIMYFLSHGSDLITKIVK